MRLNLRGRTDFLDFSVRDEYGRRRKNIAGSRVKQSRGFD
jgi:hypothetical protein